MHVTITRSMVEQLASMGPKTSVTVPVDDDILEDVLTRVLQLQEEVDGLLENLEDAALVYRRKIDELEDGARTLQESVEFGLKDGSDEWTKVRTRLEALENAHDEAVSKGERVSVEIWGRLEALDDVTAGLKEEKKAKAKVNFLQRRIEQDNKQLEGLLQSIQRSW